MRHCKILISLTLAMYAGFAYAGDIDVGWCAAYHLALGNTRTADRAINKGKNMESVKLGAREFKDRFDRDSKGAVLRASAACMSLGLPTQ